MVEGGEEWGCAFVYGQFGAAGLRVSEEAGCGARGYDSEGYGGYGGEGWVDAVEPASAEGKERLERKETEEDVLGESTVVVESEEKKDQ